MSLDKLYNLRQEFKKSFQAGATFVEFALIAPLLFLLVGGFMFYGIYFYRYEALTDATVTTVRRLATQPETIDREDLTTVGNPLSISEKVRARLLGTYTNNISNVRVGSAGQRVCVDPTINQCKMEVQMEWITPCYGFCFGFNGPGSVRVTVTQPMEDPCFLESVNGCLGAPEC